MLLAQRRLFESFSFVDSLETFLQDISVPEEGFLCPLVVPMYADVGLQFCVYGPTGGASNTTASQPESAEMRGGSNGTVAKGTLRRFKTQNVADVSGVKGNSLADAIAAGEVSYNMGNVVIAGRRAWISNLDWILYQLPRHYRRTAEIHTRSGPASLG